MNACAPCANLFFDRLTDLERERAVRSRQAEAQKKRHERRLLCAHCGLAVTREQDRIHMRGAHNHHFLNPHGIEFHIGCFARAPGCRPHGEATLEHTWFAGYAWRVALCNGCGTHLGWAFSGPGHGFFGLILSQLVTADSDDDDA